MTETKRARRVRVRRPVGAVLLPSDELAPDVDAPSLSSFAEIVPFAIEELG